MQVLESSTAGSFAISALEAPGVQGADVAGTHGIGVSVPPAAAVAEATEGLLGLEHIPKDMMLVIGTVSRMLAAG